MLLFILKKKVKVKHREGGTEIEGQYYIEYNNPYQTDSDWITDFDSNNTDWYILILML